jgi:hypothetical protein
MPNPRSAYRRSSPAASAGTTAVQADPPRNLGAPMLSGTVARASTLSAAQGAWSGAGNSYTYAWQRDSGSGFTDIAGATSTVYTIGVADENARLRVVVTATNPDATVAAASPATITVAGAPPVSLTAPMLSGGPAVRAGVLTASIGTWSGIGNTDRYGWQRSSDGATWTVVTGATGASYTLGVPDENTRVRVLVTTVNDDASVSAPSAATGVVQSAPPVNIGLPTLTGIAQRADARGGARLGHPGHMGRCRNTYSYLWQRSMSGGAWVTIAGATGPSYAVTATDEGARLRALVTASNPAGSVSVGSVASSPVATAPPVSASAPAIASGTARLGATLTATAGQWSPAGVTVSYAWQRSAGGSWTTIAGATDGRYTLTQADTGQLVRVRVTATNVDGSATATSAPSATVLAPPQSTRAPDAPGGTLLDTYTLTADPGGWDAPGASITYTWARCPAGAATADSSCTTIASGPTYTLTAADVGHPIAVSVTAASAGGTSSALWSAPSAPVAGQPLTNTSPPSITGIPQVPNRLNANPGSWSVPTTSMAYTWYRCGFDGTSNCTAVAGNVTQYTLSTADQDHTIVLGVDATSPGRTAIARSAPVTVRDQPVPVNTVIPTITGIAARGNRLTGTSGTWTNAPTYAYQWQRCAADGGACSDILGAGGTTYIAVAADEGHAIGLTVTATNGGGSTDARARRRPRWSRRSCRRPPPSRSREARRSSRVFR